jgi:hypothetical protein
MRARGTLTVSVPRVPVSWRPRCPWRWPFARSPSPVRASAAKPAEKLGQVLLEQRLDRGSNGLARPLLDRVVPGFVGQWRNGRAVGGLFMA